VQQTIDADEANDSLTLLPWQKAALASRGVDPDEVDQLIRKGAPLERDLPVKDHGDPTLGGDGLRIAIDADCPHCGWPERWFNTGSRRFGCIKCDYESDERNA
jgi:hypothetical protein